MLVITETDVATTGPNARSTTALEFRAQTTINSRERTDRDWHTPRGNCQLDGTGLSLPAVAILGASELARSFASRGVFPVGGSDWHIQRHRVYWRVRERPCARKNAIKGARLLE